MDRFEKVVNDSNLDKKSKISDSGMERFLQFVHRHTNINRKSWDELYKWSVNNQEEFWSLFSEFAAIKWHSKKNKVLTCKGEPNDPRNYQWFPKSQLNFAENLLNFDSDKIVLQQVDESGAVRNFSGKNLIAEVTIFAAYLRENGVQKGDCVAAVLSNNKEAIVGMLATASLGAIWTSCSPDFGESGILDRFVQVKPKLLLLQTSYTYNGKKYNCTENINHLADNLENLNKIVLVGDKLEFDFNRGELNCTLDFYNHICEQRSDVMLEVKLEFASCEFNDPLYILFSSGTTGKPKAIVHSVGRVLLQHKKELMLHSDLTANDKLLFFTTCGWMMWQWMASGLSLGLTLVTYDGSPGFQKMDHLWEVVDTLEVTAFGTSPKYISACMKAGVNPRKQNSFRQLKAILTTGSPLEPEHYHWLYEYIKRNVWIASISGGTDIVSCFMLGNPMKKVIPGQIQSFGLGMPVEVWNEEGQRIKEEKGELVCRVPFLPMPIYFIDDNDGSKYWDSYFNYFEGQFIWRHGDYIEETSSGGVIVYGRSDATLNPGGVRIGTSEIYRQVEELSEIKDSIVCAYPRKSDVDIVLFVVLDPSYQFDELLCDKIKMRIRSELTPRHVPHHIFEVSDIPYTRSGKKVEIAVTRTLQGLEVKQVSALANPECLMQYKHISELLKLST